MENTVAIVGIGKMGRALALRLLEKNYNIFIWNRTPKDFSELCSQGATQVQSLSDIWDHTETAITFLASDQAVSDIYLGDTGLLSVKNKNKVVIDMSTISPIASSRVASRAQEFGYQFLRSPVSGNPGVLTAGNLSLIVSGPKSVFESSHTLLSDIGSKISYVGDGEASRIVKLGINATLAATAAILSETILLCEMSNIKREHYLAALENSAMGSPFIKYKLKPLLEQDYSATFTTEMLAKDLSLTLDLADQTGAPIPLTTQVQDIVTSVCNYGFAEVDFMAILPYLQNLAHRQMDIQLPT